MNTRPRRAQRGVSLIEVLVVLVILVTGILTIIRLFPSGFSSIQSAGNSGSANSLGGAAINSGAQDAESLPDAILSGAMNAFGQPDYSTAASALAADYDPDDPNLLDHARLITNETVSIPTATGVKVLSNGTVAVPTGRSVYTVKYGPLALGIDPAVGTDSTGTILTILPQYLSINGQDWTPVDGNPGESATSPIDPQDSLAAVSPHSFLVDLKNQKIAIPYAPYLLTDSTTTPPTYTSYSQRMVVNIYASDGQTYTQYLDVPPATPQDSANPHAPMDNNTNPQGYLADTSTNYQGGWFAPTGFDAAGAASTPNYPDPYIGTPQNKLPPNIQWLKVTMYPLFTGIANTKPFDLNPYEFQLINPNITTGASAANVGAIEFNPLAARGSGATAIKAQISYMTYSWGILREDHDIPSLTGSGSTAVIRTAVPNLLRAGSANPDNSINSGIAGGNDSLIIMDLDTGKIIAPSILDPTLLNDEDTNGTVNVAPYNTINVSYSLGRLTLGSNAFGDNSDQTNSTGTAPAHRIRIFYTADLTWTVAVQKAPSLYQRAPDVVAGTDPLIGGGQCAFDPTAKKVIYFPHSDYGKTVEVDNLTAYDATGNPVPASSSAIPVVIGMSNGDTLDTLGSTRYWSASAIASYLPGTLYPKGPNNAYVTFTVRGLSARAVVAWKERNQWKVHSVDSMLNRMP